MIPVKFDYEVAESAEHAIALLGEREDAKLLAGGHSLLPAMKLRLARPAVLVDVGRLRELSYVRDAGEHVAIGALTRHQDVRESTLLQRDCPILSHTAKLMGDPQVRHRGTIGGSLAYGDPASDPPTVMLAIGAQMVVRGSDAQRVVPAAEFFSGAFRTALGPAEMLTEVRVPKLGSSTGWSYLKMKRRAQDWATVAVAAVLERSNGSIARASIGLTNMGPTPLRAAAAEQAIADGVPLAEAARLIADGTDPPTDHAASSDFRRHLAEVLGKRALREALGA